MAAALVATALVLVGLVSGGGGWLVQQRAERRAELRSEVGTAAAQAVSLRKGFHFSEARALLEQARQRLEPAGPEELRRQVHQGRIDLDLAERLDAARFQVATPVGGKFDPAAAEPLYASAFAEAGLGRVGDDREAVAAAVRGSALRTELVAALDDWASITPDRARRAWLLAVARKADPDPARDRLRQPQLWQDSARLRRLARELRVAELSPQLATALGRVAGESGGDAVALLTAAQARFPQDFWLNFELGRALSLAQRWDEANGYYRAALALRPQTSAAYCGLGFNLRAKGRLEEAIGHLQQALRIDPHYTVAHTNLISTLNAAARAAAGQGAEKARLGEPERASLRRQALDWLRACLELTARLRNDGTVVNQSLTTWQTDPALASVRDPAALAKLPDAEREPWQHLWADVAAQVAADPHEQGRARAARRDWAQAADGYARVLKRAPTDDGHFWFEYAALSLLSGDRPSYARACVHLIETCKKAGGPRAYHVARACTLAPDAVADPSLPGGLAEKELKNNAREFWSLTEQGALAYRAGRFHQAVPLFEQSLKADPKPGRAVLNWLWLALANQRLSKSAEARRWLAKAQAWLDQYRDGMPAHAEEELGLHLHNWLEAHVLRREAEALLAPR
jgi:tetratricopeptide (TPR) repeat protein